MLRIMDISFKQEQFLFRVKKEDIRIGRNQIYANG